MPLEQVNTGAAPDDPNADTVRAAFDKVNLAFQQVDSIIGQLSLIMDFLATKSDVGHTHLISDISALQAALDAKATLLHQHAISTITGLQAALDAKAPASSVWSTEQLQDLVAAMFQSGTHSNASITYDDANGTLSITASGGGGGSLTEEEVEDFVGGLVVQGTGVSVVYDDAGNVLTISLAGESYTTAEKNKLAGIPAGATANSTDAQLRARSSHTGTQAISTITGLQAALDAKAALSHSHAIGDVINLQAALDAKASQDEVVAARSGKATLNERISVISNFASPNAGAFLPGRYYDATFAANTSSSWTTLNGAMILSPFYISSDLIFDQIGFVVATAGSADAVGRCFIYDADAIGWPNMPLLETPDLPCNTTGYKGYNLPAKMTLQRATVYWLGQRFNSPTTNAAMRGINLSSSVNLGLMSDSSNQYASCLFRLPGLANPLPAPFNFTEADFRGNTPCPSVRLRYAP